MVGPDGEGQEGRAQAQTRIDTHLRALGLPDGQGLVRVVQAGGNPVTRPGKTSSGRKLGGPTKGGLGVPRCATLVSHSSGFGWCHRSPVFTQERLPACPLLLSRGYPVPDASLGCTHGSQFCHCPQTKGTINKNKGRHRKKSISK